MEKTKHKISVRGPTLSKNIPRNFEKLKKSETAFKSSMRKNLLELENEITYS